MKYLIIFILSQITLGCFAKAPAPNPGEFSVPLLEQEKQTENHAQIAMSMFCFWTGEMKLGGLEGVILTEAGWIGGREVTLVTYDETVTNLKSLIHDATSLKCANQVYVPAAQIETAQKETSRPVQKLAGYNKAKASDQKKQLQGTAFAKLDLTPAQATKVNAFARSNPAKAKAYLTEVQLKAL